MKRQISQYTFFIWVMLSMLITQTGLAQDYSGVETFDLAQLEAEIKNAKFLQSLNNTKNIIDTKYGCGQYVNDAKKQRQSLIKLQAEYKTIPVNDIYVRKDKAFRAAFTEAVQTYEKCFDYELSNFPYLVNVENINSYAVFKQKRKTLGVTLAKRGDLGTYIAMLQDQIAYEKETIEAVKKQPLENQTIEDNNNKPNTAPPAITMDSAVFTLTKMMLAYHDKNPVGVSERLATNLQKTLFQNVDTLGLDKGLYETISVLQYPYKNWKIECAACWEDAEKGNLCKLSLNTYWVRKSGGQSRMFIVQNTTAFDDYSPRITAIYDWSRKDYKRFKKREGRQCKGFPYHFPK